ncbi:MAG TPA: hypothetical protein VN711_05055, partial [Candidatus Saccharimonadales bacterium]|nr:hypothetical protein [Candidatus Saccharimonadales bacterium]
RNQGGESLRWLVSAYNPFVLFFRAASRSVPELAGITREMALEFASNSMLPRRLRQEHSLSFVGSSGRVTRGMLRGAPAQVIDGFEAEIEHQAMSTDEERMQSMLQRVQRPSGVSLEEAEQAARGAAVYALQIEDLGALGSHDGLPTVLYTYPPTEAHPLRVRMPE